MITKESLNKKYEFLANWEEELRKKLVEYLDQAIEMSDGVVHLPIKHHIAEELEGEESFTDQFPVSITIFDKHGFSHEIYITNLYKRNSLYYVDGYDNTDDEWVQGWYADDSNDTYSSLAYFVDSVLNPQQEQTEAETATTEEHKDFVPYIIGYQICDEDENYPSEFGYWDVFRTKEDAVAYIEESLDPEEYHVIEEWATPYSKSSMYRFHEMNERTFKKDEKVWITEELHNRYAIICETVTVRWYNDAVKVKELNKGDNGSVNWVKSIHILQVDKEKKCPQCGSPLYTQPNTESDHTSYCPECC